MVDRDSKPQTTMNSYATARNFNTQFSMGVKSDKEKLNSIITQANYYQTNNIYMLPIGTRSISEPFLGQQSECNKGKKTLVLDLDETLVHSSFKPIPAADIVLSIQIENMRSNVYVMVRPGTHTFLE